MFDVAKSNTISTPLSLSLSLAGIFFDLVIFIQGLQEGLYSIPKICTESRRSKIRGSFQKKSIAQTKLDKK